MVGNNSKQSPGPLPHTPPTRTPTHLLGRLDFEGAVAVVDDLPDDLCVCEVGASVWGRACVSRPPPWLPRWRRLLPPFASLVGCTRSMHDCTPGGVGRRARGRGGGQQHHAGGPRPGVGLCVCTPGRGRRDTGLCTRACVQWHHAPRRAAWPLRKRARGRRAAAKKKQERLFRRRNTRFFPSLPNREPPPNHARVPVCGCV